MALDTIFYKFHLNNYTPKEMYNWYLALFGHVALAPINTCNNLYPSMVVHNSNKEMLVTPPFHVRVAHKCNSDGCPTASAYQPGD